METQIVSYRDILKIELADRIAANPSYSLRAMARQAKISPSLLSDLLRGKKNLSPERAFEVAQCLKFEVKKCEYFSTLAQFESVKSNDLRQALLEKLNDLQPQNKVVSLNLDAFRAISDWYHLAILELTFLDGFKFTPANIALTLEISQIEAANAIERLLRLQLLEVDKNGNHKKVSNYLLSSSVAPNQALRKYHEQMLKKASESLTQQSPAEKFTGSETFAFDQDQLKKASVIIEKCFSEIVRLANSKKSKKNVYHLGIQLFRLTKKRSL